MRVAAVLTLVALLGPLLPLAAAQSASPNATGLEVHVRSRSVRPGEILAIDIDAPASVTSVTATLNDRAVALWHPSPRTWHAVAGLDVEQTPGPIVLLVTATSAAGARQTKTVTLAVQPATFPERHLSVAPRFVDPPEAERPRIEREAIRLHAIYDTVSSARTPERFVAPVPHRRSSPFGSRSVFNGQARDRHAGLDFASPAGAAVRAPAAGRVALVAPLYFTGNTVVLDHGYGVYSILAHLQQTFVHDDDVVASGDRLGTVGATGRATAPHLHWSVRVGAARVDPASLLDVLGPRAGTPRSRPPGRRPRGAILPAVHRRASHEPG